MTAFVGLDIGTSATKGIAIDRHGRVTAEAMAAHGAPPAFAGISEQDPDEWLVSARSVLARLGPQRPAGIAVAGQMHGLVLLDGRGRVLRPAILWNDGRAAAERESLEALHGLEWLVRHTGNRALPGFTAPALLWVRRHEPEVWERVRMILLPKDYVRLRLCGGPAVTDVSDASGTLLFDVERRAWSTELLDALELDPDLLPEVAESPDRVCSTPEGGAVVAGAGDQAAAALGMGLGLGTLGIALGTSGVVVGVQTDGTPVDEHARLQTMCAAHRDGWLTIGVTLSAAGSLAWWHAIVGRDLTQLLVEAAMATPGGDGLLFLPYLLGERAPHIDASARGAFVGLSAHHDRGAMTRAVVEGIAFSLADVLNLMQPAFSGVSARITGGAARSELVLTILASVAGVELVTTAVRETTAYGAALLAAIGGGALADHEEAAALVHAAEVVAPDPVLQALYAERIDVYRDLYSTAALPERAAA